MVYAAAMKDAARVAMKLPSNEERDGYEAAGKALGSNMQIHLVFE